MIASLASMLFSSNEESKNENIKNQANETKFVYCCEPNINQ